MAETQSVLLNKWNGGMSNDEYAGGSFYYGENIEIRKNSKAFTLRDSVIKYQINNRTDGDNIFLTSTPNGYLMGISKDGYWEVNSKYLSVYDSDSTNYLGPIYKFPGTVIGGLMLPATADDYGTLVVIGTDYVSRYVLSTNSVSNGFGFTSDANNLTNPGLTSPGTGRTGNNWVFGAAGATHITGNTSTLTQTIASANNRIFRLSVSVGPHSGSVVLTFGDGTLTIPANSKHTALCTLCNGTDTTDTLTITPSSDFDGKINYVVVQQYTQSLFEKEEEVSLTESTSKSYIYDGGFLYVSANNKIEVIDTTLSTRAISETFTIQGDIVGITKIGDVFNIYANIGNDGIKYIWNGIDEFPAEKITWKNKPFISVNNDGNNDYVICGLSSSHRKSLYVTNGYSKQLLYVSNYYAGYSSIKKRDTFNNRFNFKEILGFIGDVVYISALNGGIYTYGTKYAGFPQSIVKEFARSSYLDINNTQKGYFGESDYIGELHFSYEGDNSIHYFVSEYSSGAISRQGYLVTNPIIFDNIGTEKLIRKLRIGYLLPSSTCSVNVYARVNDNYYYTFDVSGVTTTPEVGAIYSNGSSNVLEVVKTDITDGVGTISVMATSLLVPLSTATGTLTKTSGTGDATISYSDRDNFIKVKTITTNKYKYANEYILGEDFIDIKLPMTIHKLQLKIELLSTSSRYAPEIFDIPVLSDIVENEF